MDKRLVLDALRSIDIDAPSSLGICTHVAVYLNDSHDCHIAYMGVTDFLEQYFESWPKFSGNPDYPVPHPLLTPAEAFSTYAHAGMMFTTHSEYGRNRRELLAFLIEELEREIGQDTAA